MKAAELQKAARERARHENRPVEPDELERARRPEPRSRIHRILRALGLVAEVAEAVAPHDPRVQAGAAGVELANEVADAVAERRDEEPGA